MNITLPISKSIAQRQLILSALHGNLLPISTNDTADDVSLMHTVLASYLSALTSPQCFDLHNSGTAMRFLTAFFAQAKGCDIVLDGSPRLRERPLSQLVDALREIGANIEYTEIEGQLPIHILGKDLCLSKAVAVIDPLSTQYISALMLIGADVRTNISSPYIDMTKHVIATFDSTSESTTTEADWSAAAFWYEDIAIHGGEYLLLGLSVQSIQGDKVCKDIFSRLGVETIETEDGLLIRRPATCDLLPLTYDFSSCPDLYPAVYATCHRLGITAHFSGLDSLRLKESNRIAAMQQIDDAVIGQTLHSFADHRIAMALLMADYQVDNITCISKSYPTFYEQYNRHRTI